jgi:hypothetical protein
MYAPNILVEHLNSLSKLKKIDCIQNKSKLKRKEKRKRTGNNNIDLIENKILQYICVHPNSNAYDIYRNGALYLGHYIDYKSIRRYIRDLSKKRLIKISPKGAKKHRAKPCRLTISGVYHLILKLRMMPWDVYKGILKNHSNGILFQQFVYPYIKQDTLLQMTDARLVLRVSSFLYECCREMERAVDSINTTENGHGMERVFAWQSVPGNENETNSLREFLKRKFNASWVDQADFGKIHDDNTLRISYRSNSILITLDGTKTKATLKIKGEQEKRYEFMVEEHSNDSFSILALSEPVEEIEAKSLLSSVQQRIPTLIFDLASNAVTVSDFSILSKDEKFMQALKETKMKFDRRYEMIIDGQRTTSSFS